MSADHLHPAKQERITSLIHTSVDDARSSLELMLIKDGAGYTLEITTGALLRLEVTCTQKTSHRKAFTTAARKALKQLERGPQS
uniref:hypothetical protein n=1 Tax=Halomonas sp. TaxID=1486246 RepID=UPI00260178E5|nr:hypothetical protein [Halomonas sp.]